VHAVVVHFGLMHASRKRQAERLATYLAHHVPTGAPTIVAGDFNDWGERLDPLMAAAGLSRASTGLTLPRTFPSRLPLFALDRFYTRGLRCTGLQVPRGPAWVRMSDHLPLIAELELV
jgi:endonuclease/exonuclease/phosphatase family metal-dependent hydrolase